MGGKSDLVSGLKDGNVYEGLRRRLGLQMGRGQEYIPTHAPKLVSSASTCITQQSPSTESIGTVRDDATRLASWSESLKLGRRRWKSFPQAITRVLV
jgi:hypothetical protein